MSTTTETHTAWRCRNCEYIEVTDEEPWTFPGPENRLARCFDSGHDWRRITITVAGDEEEEQA